VFTLSPSNFFPKINLLLLISNSPRLILPISSSSLKGIFKIEFFKLTNAYFFIFLLDDILFICFLEIGIKTNCASSTPYSVYSLISKCMKTLYFFNNLLFFIFTSITSQAPFLFLGASVTSPLNMTSMLSEINFFSENQLTISFFIFLVFLSSNKRVADKSKSTLSSP